MVITMLKSVVDSMPILFVRIGQQAAGTIDFQLSAPVQSTAMFSANVNFYNIDPFNNPYQIERSDYWPFPDDSVQMPKPDAKMEAALLESDHHEKSESNPLLGTYLEESGLGAHNPLPNIT